MLIIEYYVDRANVEQSTYFKGFGYSSSCLSNSMTSKRSASICQFRIFLRTRIVSCVCIRIEFPNASCIVISHCRTKHSMFIYIKNNMLSVNISFFLPFLFHNYVTILFRGRPQFLFLAFPQTQSLCLFWDDTANYYQFFDDKKSKQKNQTRPVHNVALAADVIHITDMVDELWAIKQKSSASQCGCVYMKFVVFQLF